MKIIGDDKLVYRQQDEQVAWVVKLNEKDPLRMKGHQAHAIWLSGIMNAEELRNFSLFEVPFSSPAAIDKSDYIDGIKSFKNELL